MEQKSRLLYAVKTGSHEDAVCEQLRAFYEMLPADGMITIPEETACVLLSAETAMAPEAAVWAVCREKEIPVVVLTADGSEDTQIRCLTLGAEDVLCLPMPLALVKKRLDNLLALSERVAIQKRVSLDPLTGALNRQFFMEYMAQRLRQNPEKEYDLVCLEMESYELLNGRYGAEICDGYMNAMVQGLRMFLPHDVMVGRIDGSHIVMMMEHVPFEMHEKLMFGCIEMAKDSPFPVFTANAGVYTNIERNLSPDEVYQNTLLAIEGIRFNTERYIAEYDNALREKKKQLRVIEKNMYRALQEQQFKVFYQPKYNTAGDRMHGAEALVRWVHPEMGFMNPAAFIPLFEKNGFIFELDKYILDAVCADIRKWLDAGMQVVPVSVNISQTDFDQTRLDQIFEKIVDKYEIPHEYIHFEITESADAPDALKKSVAVSGFRAKGFEVELDDFGAGYSTLSVLKSMPVDVMKIDMSLIRNMFEPSCRAILEGALYTAVKLNIKVVLEGVENDAQYEALKALCAGQLDPDIQGYYFSRPLPVTDFEEKLNEQ